ncbi:hypothetical protein ES754_09150 [Psychrobacter frigidicola]|uniref:Uncharacterized protein n=1 Tax=Psychrobacter frigidicola TaxID=45611 RepID=A0A5C7A1N1_9GAMM|nr:hypothetical protein [Psychrobacter frigidicola]TXD97156.1 hypothetical protein ES754_09150 [Psychrobacter frigidicola]
MTLSINKKPLTTAQLTTLSQYLRLFSTLASGILLSATSLSANASSLISSTDALDYELPKRLMKTSAATRKAGHLLSMTTLP